MFDSITLARLTFVREALHQGLAFQGDTAPIERVIVPPLDPTKMTWSERARIYGVSGLPVSACSGEHSRLGYPIPTERYIAQMKRMYGYD